jgi:hypothetical protein
MEDQGIQLHDEDSYVEYAENFVMIMQDVARKKPQMGFLAVIEACMKLEDMAYLEALKTASQTSTANLWDNMEAINDYRSICETMCGNLEQYQRKDWHNKFAENPPMGLFRVLSGRSTAAFGAATDNPAETRKRGRPPRGQESEGTDRGPRRKKKVKKSVKEAFKVAKIL